MYDAELALEILIQIHRATQIILKRCEPIKTADDFTGTDEGLEKLDAICMQLIAIGESLKKLDKATEYSLLPKYPQIDWKKVKGMRDVISHQYFDLDAEAVYSVCKNHLDPLADTIARIIKDMQSR
ncbi:MAG TPA: DUF86 domain-containing protein [Thermodesulfobacteriota bacterium]|nr:DUF86 domain-containing protein [Deltaproteobacteria bacterium]HNR12796.1 DUF86 domain-containing protein [Thermodesulfobacteriota bacterium]HNU70348.1 DUF86 domain-containing protein [Thermodesulfobacteriota bacterium]HQO78177.1 DUF86 domain-containing protein [Thermodesulfobacteriota bacterium]